MWDFNWSIIFHNYFQPFFNPRKALYTTNGPLIIEYIILTEPKNPTPAFIEALLLQSFLNENQRLPLKNKIF